MLYAGVVRVISLFFFSIFYSQLSVGMQQQQQAQKIDTLITI